MWSLCNLEQLCSCYQGGLKITQGNPRSSSSATKSLSNVRCCLQESASAEGVEEEIKWRRWVDKRFVQVITVNIYRNMRESWQTFDYITEHGNFNFAERQAARVAGSGASFMVKADQLFWWKSKHCLRASV